MEHNYWDRWVTIIERIGLTGLALTFLEGLAPVRYVFAQCLLAASPFVARDGQIPWNQFAALLEDPVESRKFAGYLREKWT